MIFEDVQKARNAHSKAIKDQEQCINDMAQKQYTLDVTEALAITALKDAGTPSTLIPKLAKGNEQVAQAKMALTIAEGLYKTAQARTQATYNDWKAALEQYDREWKSGGYQ